MTVTTESGGRQNAFPNETRPYIDAMIGFVALIGAYATTGQIIPGIF